MSLLKAPFRIAVSSHKRPGIVLTAGDHYRVCPTGLALHQAGLLTARQIDLVRLGVAVQLGDAWARRSAGDNGYRRLSLEVDLLDRPFWERPETQDRLTRCLTFLSGGDEWSFRVRKDEWTVPTRQTSLFGLTGPEPVVCLYSGGLDSASGLAIRLSELAGRCVVPVTLRSQSHRSQVIREQFDLLQTRGLARRGQLRTYQVGAYIHRRRLRRQMGLRFREVTHRCRPFLIYAVAGLAAHAEGASQVEVFESGVGAVNLPLVSGRPAWHTTRSTHPAFLRLMGDLVAHVNGSDLRFKLPFLGMTKGEMAGELVRLGVSELAGGSVSCILHPLRRGGNGQHCGYCPACVFRRQALLTAGVAEHPDAYVFDLFGNGEVVALVPDRHFRGLEAFLQQVARLKPLDRPGGVCDRLTDHLLDTRVVDAGQQDEIARYGDLFRRYRQEWLRIATEARGRGLWWGELLSPGAVAA